MAFGELLNFLFSVIVIGMLVWAGFRPKRAKPKPVPDGPTGEPYRIYTTAFDAVVNASELDQRAMSLSPDYARGHFLLSRDVWNAQIEAAKALRSHAGPARAPGEEATALFQSTAILLLVDQSGSMKGEPIAWVAAALQQLVRELLTEGATVEIAGFTTAGWQGGFARLKWLADKRPKRPGRLCALLHIVYKNFDEPAWADESWRQMVNPNLLRENVDGEALLWARSRLGERPEPRKVLLVLSDGAPVDDSTLTQNGEEYLWRHWRTVVSEIEASAEVELCAVGIDYRVDEVYARSAMASVGDDLRPIVWSLLDEPKPPSPA